MNERTIEEYADEQCSCRVTETCEGDERCVHATAKTVTAEDWFLFAPNAMLRGKLTRAVMARKDGE
jgi:hypothetical protein